VKPSEWFAEVPTPGPAAVHEDLKSNELQQLDWAKENGRCLERIQVNLGA
jgi:hypothetical protein